MAWHAGAWWGPDPELVAISCPRSAGPREAAAAVRASARLLRRASTVAVMAAGVGVLAVLASLWMAVGAPSFAPGFFRAAALLSALIGLAITAYFARLASRYSRTARALERVAAALERGLLDPDRVCGASAAVAAQLASEARL